MKKFFLLILFVSFSLMAVACDGGEDPIDPTDPVEYTVSFETNGGNQIASVTVEDGKKVTAPSQPTKEGYDFAGWFTDSALENAFSFSTNITEDITLYAKWTEVDVEAPTITANAGNILTYTQGDDAPDFKTFVTITDPTDGNITVTDAMVNTTNVNMNIVGSFVVVYSYTSTSDKSASLSLTFTIEAPVDLFGNCDPNFPEGQVNLDLNGDTVVLGTWMRNFLDPFWITAKPTELNSMKKTCITRAKTEHNANLGWYAYDNALNHPNEIIQQYVSGDFKADFYNINSHYLGQLVESGAVRPITNYMSYFPDFYQDINVQFGSWKGDVYGMWTERTNVNMGMYVNLDLINEYGLPNPAVLWNDGEWDWQALLDVSSVIKENAPANIEVFGINNYDLGSYLIGSNGGKTIDPDTDTFALSDPKAINALEYAQELKERGYVWTAEDGTDTSTRAKFTSGELAFYFGSDWISGDPSILKPGEAVQFTLGMVPIPFGPDITSVEDEYRLPITVGNLWVLRGDATDEEAEKLLQFFINTVPWADDIESDLRYTETMRDHMDDRDSLKAYVSAARYGYFEKTFLYDVVWGLPDSGSVGIGNVYAEIINTAGASVTATIEAALPPIQAKIDQVLGKDE
jgi:uncharacterized repeat protein (TIGR02543 family)